jgi:glycosyltransferase XagB
VSLTESHGPYGFSESFNYGGSIAGLDGDVLPRMDEPALRDALRRLPEEELVLSLRNKIVPIVSLPGLKLFAACGEPALTRAQNDGLRIIAYAESADLIAAARAVHGPRLLADATSGLARRMPRYSASRRLTPHQALVGSILLAAMACAALFLPVKTTWVAASAISGTFFLSVIALRVLCLLPPVRRPAAAAEPVDQPSLPVYSVLVPLFRETSVLAQLLTALTRIDYPNDKLDIKLILEESDILMQRAVAGIRLPQQFDVIVVPCGKPQTKPRALNYALQFCRGELLTIFDAEDVPEPKQLITAARAFARLPRDTACLQAQLVFYNPNENWLTRQFTIEYAILFGVLLPVSAPASCGRWAAGIPTT